MTENSQPSGITRVFVQGYKSLSDESSIEIRPFTILSGSNSSGKSSIMQPLLLLKQTLEAPYDPDPLLLDGPIIHFTSVEQFQAKREDLTPVETLVIGLEIDARQSLASVFSYESMGGIELIETKYDDFEEHERSMNVTEKTTAETLSPGHAEFAKTFQSQMQSFFDERTDDDRDDQQEREAEQIRLEVEPHSSRGFFELDLTVGFDTEDDSVRRPPPFSVTLLPTEYFKRRIRQIIHVPPLRGNPERTYKTTGTGPEFPGTFDNYVASLIFSWQRTDDIRLEMLAKHLSLLGLTEHVSTEQVNNVQRKLHVGRLPCGAKVSESDTVSIADVGFGVSQILPVLVALLAADRGQLVYLEQPEIHLHPRAQAALAEVLVEAIEREVRVVVETHSSILLRSIQTLVAEGRLPASDVMLHWFTRNDKGITQIASAELDDTGAFGEWPEDFAEVELGVESRYLDAAMPSN